MFETSVDHITEFLRCADQLVSLRIIYLLGGLRIVELMHVSSLTTTLSTNIN